jgi:NDP-sugar pyrophosphorylase family protein
MHGIILAAGRGARMGALTEATPKPLLTIAGKPLLYHIAAALPRTVDRLIIVVERLSEQVRAYCGIRFHARA